MSVLARRKVLVLNRGWHPIGVVTLEKAICLAVSTYNNGEPKARILDPTQEFRLFTWADWSALAPVVGEESIRSAKQDFRIPEIILLTRYSKFPNQRTNFSRRTIYRRDGNTCQYCGLKPGTAELSIDHVLPRSRGGKTTWENCVLCCTNCNRKKADKTPEEARMKLRRKPVKPKFSIYSGEYRCKSWEALLGAAYWETELAHDMDDEL